MEECDQHSSISNRTTSIMQLIVLLAMAVPALVAAQAQYRPPYLAYRARAGLERSAAILRSENEVNENGYRYAYETENGIQAEESGVEANGNQAYGSYSYTGDDGQLYAVRYTADVNGFRPEGAHIPTPPPLPVAIARALELNARDEAAGIYDDGSYNEGKYAPGVVAARNPYHRFVQPAYRRY